MFLFKPLLLLACVGWIFPCFSQDKITLASGEWTPYVSESLDGNGVISRIVSHAFRRAGIEVSYVYLPWTRSYAYAKEGKADGSLPWLKTPERNNFFYFSDPIFLARYYFYHLADTPFSWNSYKDLAEYRILASAGYFYTAEFEHAETTGIINTQRLASPVWELLSLMLNKRGDLVIGDFYVVEHALAHRFSSQQRQKISRYSDKISEAPHFVILSRTQKANALRIKKFNQALREMKQQGEVDRLLRLSLGPFPES